MPRKLADHRRSTRAAATPWLANELRRLQNLFIDAAIENRQWSDYLRLRRSLPAHRYRHPAAPSPLLVDHVDFKSGLTLHCLRRYFAHWSLYYYREGRVNNTIYQRGRNKFTIYFGAGCR